MQADSAGGPALAEEGAGEESGAQAARTRRTGLATGGSSGRLRAGSRHRDGRLPHPLQEVQQVRAGGEGDRCSQDTVQVSG